MGNFEIHSFSTIVVLVTFVNCAPPLDSNGNVSRGGPGLPELRKDLFCSGFNLTKYGCPSNTATTDELCAVICYLSNKVNINKVNSKPYAGNAQCPMTFDKQLLPQIEDESVRKLINDISVNASCMEKCHDAAIKCLSIAQLVGNIPIPPHLVSEDAKKSKTPEVSAPKSVDTIPVIINTDIEQTNDGSKTVQSNPISQQESIISKPVVIKEGTNPVPKTVPEPEDPKAPLPPIVAETGPEKPNNGASSSTAGKILPSIPSDDGLEEGQVGPSKELDNHQDFISNNNNNNDDDEEDLPGDQLDQPAEEKMMEGEPPIQPIRSKPASVVTHQVNTAEFVEAEDSHFFIYFLTFTCLTIIGYIAFHNKNKILALALEGRRGDRSNRRRPNSASYRKLDTSLEEAMMNHPSNVPTSHVIY